MNAIELIRISQETGNIVYRAGENVLAEAARLEYQTPRALYIKFKTEIDSLPSEVRIKHLYRWIEYICSFELHATSHERRHGYIPLNWYIAKMEYTDIYNSWNYQLSQSDGPFRPVF